MLRSTLVADVSFCFALLCFNIKYFFSRFVSTERNALDSLANAFIVKNSFLMRTTQMAQYLLPGAYDFSSNITIFSNENRTHTANTRPNTFYMDMTEFDENENTILVRMKWKKGSLSRVPWTCVCFRQQAFNAQFMSHSVFQGYENTFGIYIFIHPLLWCEILLSLSQHTSNTHSYFWTVVSLSPTHFLSVHFECLTCFQRSWHA